MGATDRTICLVSIGQEGYPSFLRDDLLHLYYGVKKPNPPEAAFKGRQRRGLRLSQKEKDAEVVLNERPSVDMLHAARLLYRGVGTPVALSLLEALDKKDWLTIVNARLNPSDYDDAYTFKLDYQCVSFLRKWSALPSGINTKQVAEQAFLRCEERCADFNKLFYTCWGKLHPDASTADVLFAARYKIERWLGRFNAEEWLANSRFGPGNSLGIKGTSDYVKLSQDPSTTMELEPYLAGILEEFPAWARSLNYDRTNLVDIQVFPGGKFSTVPKDGKTDRPIEVQPLMNGFLQLGLGAMIRRRLKKNARNDINSQTINQELACLGSLLGEIATIDLSSASDLICRELVRLLIPSEWLHAMDLCRTHVINFNGEIRPLERYASMGNGFTFELETLIFLAISDAVHDKYLNGRRPRVYGDDILVHTDEAPELMGVLENVGFLVSPHKSFVSGPFRESCGGDYFKGIPVRPYFLKEDPTNVAEFIPVVNGYARRCLGGDRVSYFDRRLVPAYAYLYRRIPLHLRELIACGSTDADDTFYWKPARKGRLRVVFQARVYRGLNYYPAVSTALYRLWARTRNGEQQAPFFPNRRDDIITRCVHPSETARWAKRIDEVSLSGSGEITNYRRDSGTWVLRPVAYTPGGGLSPPLLR